MRRGRVILGALSVAGMIALYAVVSTALERPGILPPIPNLLTAFAGLVGGRHDVTLQGALLVSTLRVLFGLVMGGSLGVLVGLAMGWSRTVDDYVHPIYVLLRSIPPLALIAYVMLWLGHGEAHLLIPIVYAVLMTVVLPTYHGVRDVRAVYVDAARALGAGRPLLLSRVVLPAAAPLVLAGLRHALVIAWMTTVGVEMLMSNDGVGHLIVGGGLWSSRLEIGVDPAVVMVAIAALATVGYAMDAVARGLTRALTSWASGAA